MFEVKRVKYRKPFKIIPKKKTAIRDRLNFGAYGLLVLDNALLSAKQLDAARKAIIGYIKRKGKLWIRVFPDRPITKRPAEVKMGKGKGDVDYYAAIVRKGAIIFELGGVDEEIAREAFRRAAYKLPVKVKFVKEK